MSEIADHYDGFILDLWGVLHDGDKAYPGVVETLERLKDRGKFLLALSNAPHREDVMAARMVHMGIPQSLYDGIITSGDIVHEELQRRESPLFAQLGRRYFLIGLDIHEAIADGLDYDRSQSPVEADFVLNTGPREVHETVDDYRTSLDICAARHLPMVCANPDHSVIRDGRLVACGGALAAYYESIGGAVVYRGKPDSAVYRAALLRMGSPQPATIAVVGDSLETDIRGAVMAGLDSVFVTGGVHGQELAKWKGRAAADRPFTIDAVRHLIENYACRPTMSIPAFVW